MFPCSKYVALLLGLEDFDLFAGKVILENLRVIYHFPIDPLTILRGTGRTTKMLCEAIAIASQGYQVHCFCGNKDLARIITQQLNQYLAIIYRLLPDIRHLSIGVSNADPLYIRANTTKVFLFDSTVSNDFRNYEPKANPFLQLDNINYSKQILPNVKDSKNVEEKFDRFKDIEIE